MKRSILSLRSCAVQVSVLSVVARAVLGRTVVVTVVLHSRRVLLHPRLP